MTELQQQNYDQAVDLVVELHSNLITSIDHKYDFIHTLQNIVDSMIDQISQ